MTSLKSKFEGGIIGAAIGDSLGMPVEGWSLERIRAEIGEVREMRDSKKRVAGTWTDDTALTIAVAESLIDCKGFDAEDMKQKFLRHYDPNRGYGPTVKVALGIAPCEMTEEEKSKIARYNGSAMRIAPIGLLYYDDPVKLRSISFGSSKITHGHALAHEGAALQAYAVASLVQARPGTLVPNSYVGNLKDFVMDDTYSEQLRKITNLLDQRDDRQRIIEQLGNGIEAHRAVPPAIYSFVTHCESFAEAVIYAVNLGGDADTIASMAGALSGVYLGVDAIPSEWRLKLENASYLYQLADNLYQTKMEQQSA